MDFNILFEDQHIIVIEKPPKVPCQSDKTNDMDLLSYIKQYLIKQGAKVNNPYVGLIHRLDRPVGGVMVFAKTKFANTKLSEAIRKREIEKEYLAVVCGKVEEKKGVFKDYLVKHKTINMSKVVEKDSNGAKEAILQYEKLAEIEDEANGILSLVKIKLITGRHHQIRVQFSNRGLPLWGDNKYNKQFVKNREWTQIALWSNYLKFNHPKTQKQLEFKLMPNNQFPFTLFL